MDCIFVLPPNSYVEALIWWYLEMKTLGDIEFTGCVGEPHDGISILTTRRRELDIFLRHARLQQEEELLPARQHVLTRTQPRRHPDLRRPSFQNCEK